MSRTQAAERTYQATRLLARGVNVVLPGGPEEDGLDPSGNASEGWVFTFVGEDGNDYNVEVCAAGLSEEELREEGDL